MFVVRLSAIGILRNSFQPPLPSGAKNEVAAVGGELGGEADPVVVVGDEAGEPVVLLHQFAFAGLDVEPIDVVELGLAVVEADEDFAGELVADFFDLGPHLFQRRQVVVFRAVEVSSSGVLEVSAIPCLCLRSTSCLIVC